jgi:hypothetical protein
VVHISIAFVVYGHHVQEHDVGGGRFESAESHLDSGEHPPTGETRKQHGQPTVCNKQENNEGNAEFTIDIYCLVGGTERFQFLRKIIFQF